MLQSFSGALEIWASKCGHHCLMVPPCVNVHSGFYIVLQSPHVTCLVHLFMHCDRRSFHQFMQLKKSNSVSEVCSQVLGNTTACVCVCGGSCIRESRVYMEGKINELLECLHGHAPLPVRRLVTGVWTTARGILYPQRKPHPQASGEWLFVVVTCEALLLKRILVLSPAFKAKLIHGSNKVSFLGFSRVWSESYRRASSMPCILSSPVIFFFFFNSMLSCIPYSRLVNCDQFKTLRVVL